MKKIISITTIILALSAANTSFAYDSYNGKYTSIKSSPGASKATFDIQFLDTMLAHHRQQIEISKMAADKSQNELVRTKAQLVIDTQESDISQMESIRSDIQDKAPEAVNMSMDGMFSVDSKDLYSKPAKDFDEEFVRILIKHKEGSKKMANNASKNAKNAKVKQIADQISDRESGEIAELKEMLKKLD